MKKRAETDAVNLTPMIDIVFQMIIFFVFTLDLEREKFDPDILIPEAEAAEEIETFNPGTIYPQVLEDGQIKIGSAIYPVSSFRRMIRNMVRREGQGVPVMIYGDARTEHRHIKKVMDICSEEGLYKINVIGLIEKGQ